MGVTGKSIDILKTVINHAQTVCELGDQLNFTHQPPVYMSEWYKERGKDYMSIDLNGLNDSKQWDLSEPLKTSKKFDLVTDFGTSEHVKDIYQCFANINKLTKVGGIMVHENPKTKNWPKHGMHYRDQKFYIDLAIHADYHIIRLEEHPAMGNSIDGWNIICVMRKRKEGFIDRELFPKTYTE